MLIVGKELERIAREHIDGGAPVVGSSSIDITLGERFAIVRRDGGRITQDFDMRPIYDGLEERTLELGEVLELEPGMLVIAHSREYIRMPKDAGAFLALRSSLGRRGVDHLHAGWIEPGWNGQITFELTAVVPTYVIVGESIAQLVFIRAEDKSQYDGHYQGQTGVTLEQGAKVLLRFTQA